jgi:site-specific DNA-cytosine methylase
MHLLMMCFCCFVQACGIPLKTIAFADVKTEAQRFLLRNFSPKHLFKNSAMMVSPDSPHLSMECLVCGNEKPCDYAKEDPVCLATAGLPCQPFTGMRNSPTKCAPGKHRLFSVVSEFLVYLEERKPLGFVVEEVAGIRRRDPTTGKSFLEGIMQQCAELGYSTEAIDMNSDIWIQMSRPRPAVCTCHMHHHTTKV